MFWKSFCKRYYYCKDASFVHLPLFIEKRRKLQRYKRELNKVWNNLPSLSMRTLNTQNPPLKIEKMSGCFEKPFANDTSLDLRPLPSLQKRRRCSALSWRSRSVAKSAHAKVGFAWAVTSLFFAVRTLFTQSPYICLKCIMRLRIKGICLEASVQKTLITFLYKTRADYAHKNLCTTVRI